MKIRPPKRGNSSKPTEGSVKTTEADTTEVVETLQHQADSIDRRLTSYQVAEKDLDESTQRGMAKGYFKTNRVGKIEAKHYGEMGKRHIHYFFKEGELFLIADTSFYYERPLSLGNVSVDSTEATEFFLKDGLPFTSRRNGNRAVLDSSLWNRITNGAEQLETSLARTR